MRRAAKVDLNQAEIVAALRKAGCSVQSLAAIGHGCPDILVARANRMWLMELKAEKGKLTDDQIIWHSDWNAPIHIVRSVLEALTVVKHKRI